MKTFKQITKEAYQTGVLNAMGYFNPQKGADGHITYTKDNYKKILVDLPGNEWHLMVDGVVKVVGHMDDNSLLDYFLGKSTARVETEETEDKDERLARQRIYEPDGGTYSSTPSTPGGA
jgi:hypothetical protein